jgi:hypothetical protein
MSMAYDSAEDTLKHIGRVAELLDRIGDLLMDRADRHDASKLVDPEKAAFDVLTPRLKGLTYGSDEYKASLREMKPALDHHYAHNSHHPEHYIEGVNGMSLLDVVEMLCDWKAATERHADGSIRQSLLHNFERFNISPQLANILINTVEELGWEG